VQSPPPEGPPGGWGQYLPPGVDPQTQANLAAGTRNDPLAGVSLALGIASLPAYMCCGFLSLALNVVGLVLGVISFMKSRDPTKNTNKGLAIAALCVNGLVLLLNLGMVGFMAFNFWGGGRGFP
jgi:hypothetical protein